MEHAASEPQRVLAGETASIENVHTAALSISVSNEDGCKVALELAPGQVLGYTAGKMNAELTLHEGDPAGLRVIKPTTAA